MLHDGLAYHDYDRNKNKNNAIQLFCDEEISRYKLYNVFSWGNYEYKGMEIENAKKDITAVSDSFNVSFGPIRLVFWWV